MHNGYLVATYTYVQTDQHDQNRMCLLDHLIIVAFDYIHDHISACTLLSSIEYVHSNICIYALYSYVINYGQHSYTFST